MTVPRRCLTTLSQSVPLRRSEILKHTCLQKRSCNSLGLLLPPSSLLAHIVHRRCVRIFLYNLRMSVSRNVALGLLRSVVFFLSSTVWSRPIKETPLHHIRNTSRHQLILNSLSWNSFYPMSSLSHTKTLYNPQGSQKQDWIIKLRLTSEWLWRFVRLLSKSWALVTEDSTICISKKWDILSAVSIHCTCWWSTDWGKNEFVKAKQNCCTSFTVTVLTLHTGVLACCNRMQTRCDGVFQNSKYSWKTKQLNSLWSRYRKSSASRVSGYHSWCSHAWEKLQKCWRNHSNPGSTWRFYFFMKCLTSFVRWRYGFC